MHATRIKLLPKNTVIFHTVSEQRFTGTIESLPTPNRAATSRRLVFVTFVCYVNSKLTIVSLSLKW